MFFSCVCVCYPVPPLAGQDCYTSMLFIDIIYGVGIFMMSILVKFLLTYISKDAILITSKEIAKVISKTYSIV